MLSCPLVMPCLGAGRADELLDQGGGLAGGDHPADGVAGVDVHDHVQVVVGPLHGAVQLADVPRPDLVRPGGDEFGLDDGEVGGLRAPFPASLPSQVQRGRGAGGGRPGLRGFSAIRVEVSVAGPESAQRYQELATVDEHGPVLDLFRNMSRWPEPLT
jgi:hypothetical protein